MPSVLDMRVDKAIAALSAEGGALPLGRFTLPCGVAVPIVANAPATLRDYFAHFCAEHADADFIVDGEERLSFAVVHDAAIAVAQALIGAYGLKKGDRVGIAMRNAPLWIVIYMGILMAGGVATLLNGWWQGAELCTGIADVGCTLVFADPQRAKRIMECDGNPGCDIITLDIALPLDQAMAPIRLADGQSPLPGLTGDDIATILFTSGSTGQSKGAYSTHRAVVQGTFCYIAQALMQLQIGIEDGAVKDSRPQHATLMTVPMFHVTGEVPMMLLSFAIGRKIVMMPKWDVLHALQLIERERVTSFTGVPLMSWEIMNHPERANYDLSSVQGFAAGGAPRPPEHVRRLNDELSAPPQLGYGLTETNGVGCGSFSTNYLDKPNSTGRAYAPLVDVAILDDDGQRVAQGDRGEICIRTVANFSGYWNRDDATRSAMTSDGYFRTGDIGYLDPDSYLYIVDRKKDIIIRGGENISCQEVEAAIYAHPCVAEACVFGLPDERLGEIVGAVVHYHPGRHVSDEALCFFLGETLAPFKVPVRIWVSDDPLPRLGTEKIDKVSLRNRFRSDYEADIKMTA